MSELHFANENDALQYLADLTEMRVMIGAEDEPLKIPDDLRSKVNTALNKDGFDGGKSFENMSKAIFEIEEVLNRFQLLYGEDTSAGKFSGLNGQRLITLAQKNLEDSLESTPISNATLEIDWSPMGDTDGISVAAQIS